MKQERDLFRSKSVSKAELLRDASKFGRDSCGSGETQSGTGKQIIAQNIRTSQRKERDDRHLKRSSSEKGVLPHCPRDSPCESNVETDGKDGSAESVRVERSTRSSC